MKISQEVKEVSVGVTIALSNTELLVLDTEVQELSKSLEKGKTKPFFDEENRTINVKAKSLINVLSFVNKITKGNIVSLEQAYSELFLPEDSNPKSLKLTEESVNDLVEASTVRQQMSMNDKENI